MHQSVQAFNAQPSRARERCVHPPPPLTWSAPPRSRPWSTRRIIDAAPCHAPAPCAPPYHKHNVAQQRTHAATAPRRSHAPPGALRSAPITSPPRWCAPGCPPPHFSLVPVQQNAPAAPLTWSCTSSPRRGCTGRPNARRGVRHQLLPRRPRPPLCTSSSPLTWSHHGGAVAFMQVCSDHVFLAQMAYIIMPFGPKIKP